MNKVQVALRAPGRPKAAVSGIRSLQKYMRIPAISKKLDFWKSFQKKNIEKIHFLIFQKQNTFTKHEKLENCGKFIQKKPVNQKSRIYSVSYTHNIWLNGRASRSGAAFGRHTTRDINDYIERNVWDIDQYCVESDCGSSRASRSGAAFGRHTTRDIFDYIERNVWDIDKYGVEYKKTWK